MLKEIMTSLSSLVAIVLSFSALIIAIKNRRNTMREIIYVRQLDAFEMIKEQINELSTLAYQYFYSHKKDANERFISLKESSEEAIKTAYSELNDLLELKVIILPTDIFVEIQEFNVLIEGLIMNPQARTLAEITARFISVENSMRDFIGLEKLTDENRKLVK